MKNNLGYDLCYKVTMIDWDDNSEVGSIILRVLLEELGDSAVDNRDSPLNFSRGVT